MSKLKVGLAGLGQLGSAMMKHWSNCNEQVGAYHPNKAKLKSFVCQYTDAYPLEKLELGKLDVLILALPAHQIIPFLTDLQRENILHKHTLFINMATSLDTNEVIKAHPKIQIASLKFMGHAKDLHEHGNGLFISEKPLPENVCELLSAAGKIFNDDPDIVQKVNRIATYYAVKAAKEIESEFKTKGLPPYYLERALSSLAPEVIRSYGNGTLGHFGKKVAQNFDG
jgi:pyrroline-5-carboxylate reductase